MVEDRTHDNDVLECITERWPQTGDRLFAPSRTATLAHTPDERLYRLTRGYKRAADVLVENTLCARGDQRNLIYPIVFCYRHYIELAPRLSSRSMVLLSASNTKRS